MIKSSNRAYFGLAIAVIAISSAAILARLCVGSLGPVAVAFWRKAIAAALLAIWLAVRGRLKGGRLPRRAILAGVLLGAHFGLWISSLWLTSVGSSVVLVAAQPLIVLLAAPKLLGFNLRLRHLGSFVLAAIGIVIIGWGDLQISGDALLGDVLAFGGAIAAAGYLMIGSSVVRKVELERYLAVVYGTAATTLGLAALVTGADMIPRQPSTWAWIICMALGPSLIGHSLLNWAMKSLPAYSVNLWVLLEPVLASLLAWWILAEAPSTQLLFGAPLVLAALAVETKGATPVA